MPTEYKGLTIPLSVDRADGNLAFRQYTDSLPESEGIATMVVPVGTVIISILTASALPSWLLLDGSTVAAAQTTYPKLWAIVPAAWHSGTDLVLPDMRGRIAIGADPSNTALDVVGEMTGSKTATILTANLPPHAHAQAGTHRTGNNRQGHVHAGPGGNFLVNAFAAGFAIPAGGSGMVGAGYTADENVKHDHDVTLSGNTGNGPGTSTPLNILPPVMAFNFLIRAA